MQINIGIFAHNEENKICHTLQDLVDQSVIHNPKYQISIYVLANGCTDNTASQAQKFADENLNNCKIFIEDLSISGKSRTWNHFVHKICKESSCDIVVFMDADIKIPDKQSLQNLIDLLISSGADAVNSKPVKDTSNLRNISFVQKLITASAGTFSDYKNSICGQLYATHFKSVEDLYLPVGLPVEDGFIRAMIISTYLTEPDNFSKITGTDEAWHEYESITTVSELIRHQQRIIVGSAINTAIFSEICRKAPELQQRKQLLKNASENPAWLDQILKEQLPKFPYGYVPFHFFTKRQKKIFGRSDVNFLRKIFLSVSGLAFDLIVYAAASYKLARGKGAGFW